MPRRKRCRWVAANPAATFFKPRGVPMAELEQVILELDEVEALRLADLEGRYQEDAAKTMGVSRQTFGRIVEMARRKVAEALLHGKALVIEHGSAAVYACAPTRRCAAPTPFAGQAKEKQPQKDERSSNMKLAVTSEGDGLDAPVDPRFGRCTKFVLVDPDTLEHESVENDAANADAGAGISAAQTVVRLGAKAVITGSCGPKAFSVLSGAGIPVYTGATGTVRDAVAAFKAGKLRSAAGPNAAGHSGMRK